MITSSENFETQLTEMCKRLTVEARKCVFKESSEFEKRVREVTGEIMTKVRMQIDYSPHPYIFPDIVLGKYGIEVKFTTNDTWRSIANSVFETTRDNNVEHIYVIYGKMGGLPEVRWRRYEECVMHVRTSHVPRFELDIQANKSLFGQLGISYEAFSAGTIDEKMKYIRKYARDRMKPGEHLWWLEDVNGESHTLPLQVRLYMALPQEEKRKLRAEASLLCPQVVKSSRSRGKYVEATVFLLTYYGVLCPQARDLFSAGSVALRGNDVRGGLYIMRALQDIEAEMRAAAQTLEDALFVEYWGKSVEPRKRIGEWLKMADKYAEGWIPSEVLFRQVL